MPSHRRNLLGAAGQSAATEPFVGIRTADDIEFFLVSDWSSISSFTTLSCGAIETPPISTLEISPDGTWFLTSGTLGVGAYSVADGSELFFFSNTNAQHPAMSKDGAYIAFLSEDPLDISIYETATWTETLNFDFSSAISAPVFAFSWDGTKLAVAQSGSRMTIYNTSDGTAYSSELNIRQNIRALAFSRDDTIIASGIKGAGGANRDVYASTVSASMTLGDLYNYDDGNDSTFIEFLPDDSKLIWSTDATGTANGISVPTSTWTTEVKTPSGASGNYAGCMSPDGAYLLTTKTTTPFTEIIDTSDMTIVGAGPTAAAVGIPAWWA